MAVGIAPLLFGGGGDDKSPAPEPSPEQKTVVGPATSAPPVKGDPANQGEITKRCGAGKALISYKDVPILCYGKARIKYSGIARVASQPLEDNANVNTSASCASGAQDGTSRIKQIDKNKAPEVNEQQLQVLTTVIALSQNTENNAKISNASSQVAEITAQTEEQVKEIKSLELLKLSQSDAGGGAAESSTSSFDNEAKKFEPIFATIKSDFGILPTIELAAKQQHCSKIIPRIHEYLQSIKMAYDHLKEGSYYLHCSEEWATKAYNLKSEIPPVIEANTKKLTELETQKAHITNSLGNLHSKQRINMKYIKTKLSGAYSAHCPGQGSNISTINKVILRLEKKLSLNTYKGIIEQTKLTQ
jgi:hypothetical protein